MILRCRGRGGAGKPPVRAARSPGAARAARRQALTLADLDGEPILDAHARRTSSVEEKFELIAAGHGIAMVPRSVAQSYSRSDLVFLPVTDAVPAGTCVVVAEDRRERRVLDFVTVAAETLGDQPAPLAAVD